MRKVAAKKGRLVCSECGEPIQWMRVEYEVFECPSDEELPTGECAILVGKETLYDTVRLYCGCGDRKVSDLIEQLRELCERPKRCEK